MTQCILIEKIKKNCHKFTTNLDPCYVMAAKIKIRQYVIFIKPRKFDTAKYKCLTVFSVSLQYVPARWH